MAEHKWADVLRAIANKGIQAAQYQINEPSEPWNPASERINPVSHPHFEWRIKPEPKPDVYRWGVASLDGMGATVENLGDANLLADNNLCLTFDGETGKLKSAEVLP